MKSFLLLPVGLAAMAFALNGGVPIPPYYQTEIVGCGNCTKGDRFNEGIFRNRAADMNLIDMNSCQTDDEAFYTCKLQEGTRDACVSIGPLCKSHQLTWEKDPDSPYPS